MRMLLIIISLQVVQRFEFQIKPCQIGLTTSGTKNLVDGRQPLSVAQGFFVMALRGRQIQERMLDWLSNFPNSTVASGFHPDFRCSDTILVKMPPRT